MIINRDGIKSYAPRTVASGLQLWKYEKNLNCSIYAETHMQILTCDVLSMGKQ